MELNSKQRKFLEALAHDMEPVVRIGKFGVTKTVIKTVSDNLEARELIKVKILENAEIEREEAAQELVLKANCTLVRIIGRVLVLFRSSKTRKKGKIEFPDPSKKAVETDTEEEPTPKKGASKKHGKSRPPVRGKPKTRRSKK